MSQFAVIDTETTWSDEVMSIGIAVAKSEDFGLIDKRYYILTPFKNHGGMYTCALYAGGTVPDLVGSRTKVINDIIYFLADYGVFDIFAYNAVFDCRHLPELGYLRWYDIMKLAAYRQYNRKIPSDAECCGTGKLKRGYGVENIYRMLSGDAGYCELHNALTDALDELEIMRLLGVRPERYASAAVGV